jgi:hypothetical protein
VLLGAVFCHFAQAAVINTSTNVSAVIVVGGILLLVVVIVDMAGDAINLSE